jgi:hypothetical protein
VGARGRPRGRGGSGAPARPAGLPFGLAQGKKTSFAALRIFDRPCVHAYGEVSANAGRAKDPGPTVTPTPAVRSLRKSPQGLAGLTRLAAW